MRCEWEAGLWDWAWEGWVGVAISGELRWSYGRVHGRCDAGGLVNGYSQGWPRLRMGLDIADKAVALLRRRRCFSVGWLYDDCLPEVCGFT